NALYRLLTIPGAYQRVRADRSLVEPFIEESLRFDPPLTQMPRRCRVQTEVGGLMLDEDEVVVVSVPSANRDGGKWGPDADDFVVERFLGRDADHVAFGLGVHHCVGAFLARQTARIALNRLMDAMSDLDLAPGSSYDKVCFFQFWRPKRLDVVFGKV